jgi:hypothetical protein
MADLMFAFDPALDRPLPVPEDAAPAVAETIAGATRDALAAAVACARRSRAGALILCGRLLSPDRASPAQAAFLRGMVADLAAEGCRTVYVADDTAACHAVSRMLGEPAGLHFVTPLAPIEVDVHGLRVEIVSAHGPAAATAVADPGGPAPLHRRIVVGWDTALWQAERWDAEAAREAVHPALATGDTRTAAAHLTAAAFAAAAAASPAWSHPATFWVWGSRRATHLPPGLHHLPALQARSGHEPSAGACCGLTLFHRDPALGSAAPSTDWRASWEHIPTHRVAWRTLAIESPAGGDEELATAIWSALEARTPAAHAALEIVRCSIACGTSVARRVRVAEIAAETLARVRQLYDAKNFRVWCRELVADPDESLAPLGHARSGSRPGSTTSFSSALADIVTAIEQSPAAVIPPDMAREAGWLALELVEST